MHLLISTKNIEKTNMEHHRTFIISPINRILEDVTLASTAIGNGIETFPLCDYIMQSVFLKMTGFQEQKMKCITWALATNDYEYRYELTKKPLGECSHYEDKQALYKNIIKSIKKITPNFNVRSIDKATILTNSIDEVKRIFINSNLAIWTQRSYNDFLDICTTITDAHFANDEFNLFTQTNIITLKQIYNNNLYPHRNRCAHNTYSYQQNLPTLTKLADTNYKYDNYFVWFVTLILIDKVFIQLYLEFEKALKERQ